MLTDHIIRYPSVFTQLSINFPFNLYYVFILTCFSRCPVSKHHLGSASLGALIVRILFFENSFHFYLNGLNCVVNHSTVDEMYFRRSQCQE